MKKHRLYSNDPLEELNNLLADQRAGLDELRSLLKEIENDLDEMQNRLDELWNEEEK